MYAYSAELGTSRVQLANEIWILTRLLVPHDIWKSAHDNGHKEAAISHPLLLFKKLLLLLSTWQLRNRRYWVHPVSQMRETHGEYGHFVGEIHRYVSMNDGLKLRSNLALVSPLLTCQETIMRKAIDLNIKQAVTLHHLAEGTSHSSLALHHRLGRSTVSNIIYKTCDAIWEALQPLYLEAPNPSTPPSYHRQPFSFSSCLPMSTKSAK